jgi:hypothetical protein
MSGDATPRIFISYSRKDGADFAAALRALSSWSAEEPTRAKPRYRLRAGSDATGKTKEQWL